MPNPVIHAIGQQPPAETGPPSFFPGIRQIAPGHGARFGSWLRVGGGPESSSASWLLRPEQPARAIGSTPPVLDYLLGEAVTAGVMPRSHYGERAYWPRFKVRCWRHADTIITTLARHVDDLENIGHH